METSRTTKCSIQQKRQIQRVVRDRMNSICPMNFFRTTDTTDATIWKPGLRKEYSILKDSDDKVESYGEKLERKKWLPTLRIQLFQKKT